MTTETELASSQASYTAGMNMLRASRSMREWTEATRLIEDASAAGIAEASERCAIFHCMGVARPVNWERAFDLLTLSAEQGSSRAGRQLAMLAERSGARQAEPDNWAAFRSALSLERILSAPPVQLVSVCPRIGVVEGFATPEECSWLIESAQGNLLPATIYDSGNASLRPDGQRTNRTAECNPLTVGIIAEVIRARLSRCIGLALANYELSQVLHYSVGQEFKPHHDYFDPAKEGFQKEISTRGQRVATQLIYLNEEYEGGVTQFPSIGIDYRGKTGDALMFFNINESGDPEPLTLHTGLPPTSGEKWIFSQWIRDRRPAQAPQP
ncbi:MAG: 2OG-Fe(II) oxygenase [Sphingomicrobium sp.]